VSGVTIDVSHDRNLVVSLQHIALVDAEGVDPQGAWLVRLPDIEEGSPKIFGNHEGTSIDLYRRKLGNATPDIAQSIIISEPAIQGTLSQGAGDVLLPAARQQLK
jgi:hypothetical protein